MDRMEAETSVYLACSGGSWELNADVADLAFDNSSGAVAFALADGSVAIARTKDAEPAANAFASAPKMDASRFFLERRPFHRSPGSACRSALPSP